jgi:hypothetical protein
MSLAAVRLLPDTGAGDIMVDIMGKWDQEHYASRHISYYPHDENQPEAWRENRQESQQVLYLPPPSRLVSDVHYNQGLPMGRSRAYHNDLEAEDAYAHVPAMSVQRAAPTPTTGSESYPLLYSSDNKRPIDGASRHSPAPSSSPSERSEGLPEHLRLRRLGDQTSTPTLRPRSQLTSLHEHSPRQKSIVDIRSIRPPRDAQLPHLIRTLSSQGSTPAHLWPSQPEARGSERMKIADLLSYEQNAIGSERSSRVSQMVSQKVSQKASQKAPQQTVRPAAFDWNYRVHIRQQPIAARSCGYGERDRRVIDPPPIIEMTIDDPTASEDEIKERLTHSYSIMHCTIWNEAGDQDMSSMPEDYRTQRRLMGTVVSSPFAGRDENDEYGCFFCFPDLSCRTPGSFRLQFSFMVLDPTSSPGYRTPVLAVVMSDVFTVYNAKDFPGMKASTPLTKRLKEQGCLISIKKGNDKNDRVRKRDDSDSNEEDVDEDDEHYNGGNTARRSKRARRP